MHMQRRGSILVLSLLVVTIGTLVGTSIIYYAGADRRAAQMSLRRVQARAMAWSGVQAVMAELASQREALLAGETPSVTETWISPTAVQGAAIGAGAGDSSGGVRWGFRVLPVATNTLVSEMGRLDVNNAPAALLAKLPGVGEDLAARIVAAREKRRFASVAELLSVEGVTHALLYAPDENAAPLHRLITVYSFDPEVQVGFGAKADESAGKQRININAPWSEELGDAIERRFDRNVASGVKSIMERGDTFQKPSTIVKKLRELQVEPKDWIEILDAFTTNPDQYRLGAVDLLTAPVAVLECIPGITPEAAQEIVDRRGKIDASRRSTVAWPVLEDILKPEEFEQAVDFLTSRSLQWRIVVEGGVFPRTDNGLATDRAPDWEPVASESTAGGAPLEDRVVLEAVIDVASLRPRVAYLRDVTFLPTARALQQSHDRERQGEQTTNIDEETAEGIDSKSLPDAFHTELNTPKLNSPPRAEADRDDSGNLDIPHLDSQSDADDDAKEGEDRRSTGSEPTPAVTGGRDQRLGRWTTGARR